LGERLNGIQEVVGSIPSSSTKYKPQQTADLSCWLTAVFLFPEHDCVRFVFLVRGFGGFRAVGNWLAANIETLRGLSMTG
jgi:hypothetical protein